MASDRSHESFGSIDKEMEQFVQPSLSPSFYGISPSSTPPFMIRSQPITYSTPPLAGCTSPSRSAPPGPRFWNIGAPAPSFPMPPTSPEPAQRLRDSLTPFIKVIKKIIDDYKKLPEGGSKRAQQVKFLELLCEHGETELKRVSASQGSLDQVIIQLVAAYATIYQSINADYTNGFLRTNPLPDRWGGSKLYGLLYNNRVMIEHLYEVTFQKSLNIEAPCWLETFKSHFLLKDVLSSGTMALIDAYNKNKEEKNKFNWDTFFHSLTLEAPAASISPSPF
jgi:hypothetical protein